MDAGPEHRKKSYVILAMLAAALLFLALFPYILSTGPVLRLVVGGLEKRIPGSLSVGSWLVGWRQGILCQEVVYRNPSRGIHLRIPRLTSTQGVLELALAPSNLGLVALDGPQLTITPSGRPPADPPAKAARRSSAVFSAFWNHLIADLEIRDGQATITHAEPALTSGFRDLSLSASLQNGAVTYTFGAHALGDQGTVKATGSINLPAGGEGGVRTVVTDGKLTVSALQLRDLLTLAANKAAFPAGEGTLGADLRFKTVGLEGLEVSGQAEFNDLTLQGGFLNEDSPSWERLRMQIDGGRFADREWSARSLKIFSDTGELSGSFSCTPDSLHLDGKGSINLPVLFAQFPGLLHLREGTRAETGVMDLALVLESSGEKRLLNLKAGVDVFTGLADEREIAWAGPLSMMVNGETGDDEFRLNALKLASPFLQIDGRGDLQSLVLDAEADLAQAFADIGQLFQLEWDGAGRLDLAAKGRSEGEGANLFTLETDLQISNVTLRRAGELVVPRGDFSLLGDVRAPVTVFAKGTGTIDLRLALSSWLGETFLTLKGEKQVGVPFRGAFSTDTSLVLDSASGLLHVLNLLPAAATVTGDMQMQAAGNLGANELEVRELAAEIAQLTLAREGASFNEPLLRLEITRSINEEITAFTAHDLVVVENRAKFFRTGAGSNLVNFADRSLFLHNLKMTSGSGTCTLTELLIPDWRRPESGLDADLTGVLDLAWLTGLLRGAAVFKGEIGMAGTGRLSVHAGTGEEGSQGLAGEVRLTDVALLREKNATPLSRELRIAAQLFQPGPEGDIAIEQLRLDSDPLQVEAGGVISREGERRKIEVQGRMTPALERLSDVLREGFGIDLRLAGGQGESFLAQYLPASDSSEEQGAFSLVTSLHADRFEYEGIAVRSLHLPISLENGALHLEGTAQADEGKVDLIVDTDLTAVPPVITIPANSQILTGFPLQRPLVDLLLSGQHPLFGVLADPAGQFDLRFNSFSWPLKSAQSKSASVATVIDLGEITLESNDFLRQILSLFGLEKEKIGFIDNELACTTEEGKVTCPPVRLRVGDAEMSVSGAMGLDGTLNYLLEVPLTGKLVNEEGLRLLRGVTVRVPVRGTKSAPVFDRDKTLAVIRDLLQQAASKLKQEKERKPSSLPPDKTIPAEKG